MSTSHTFDPDVAASLRFYVYLLIDPSSPRGPRAFYVGKGKGNRVFNHVREVNERLASGESLKQLFPPRSKLGTIERLVNSGTKVQHVIVRHGLTEREATEVEAAIIDVLRYHKIRLTNLVRGSDAANRGCSTAADLNNRYGPVKLANFDRPCILVRLNEYDPNWSAEELYQRVRGWWRIPKERRMEAKYVACVPGGLIREVYSLDARHWDKRWEQRPEDRKWACKGKAISAVDRANKWLRADVRRYFLDKEGRNNRWQNIAYVGFREVVD